MKNAGLPEPKAIPKTPKVKPPQRREFIEVTGQELFNYRIVVEVECDHRSAIAIRDAVETQMMSSCPKGRKECKWTLRLEQES